MEILAKLEEEMKKDLKVKIGILGSSDGRPDGESNVDIGTKHEFGLEGMPQRSFLRMTYMMKSEEFKAYLKKNENNFRELIIKSGLSAALMEMGRFWLEEIDKTFASEGYGNWPAISEAWAEEKGFDSILVHTGELRRSITAEVSE